VNFVNPYAFNSVYLSPTNLHPFKVLETLKLDVTPGMLGIVAFVIKIRKDNTI